MEELYEWLLTPSERKNSATAIGRFIRWIKTTSQQQWQDYDMEKSLLCTIKLLSLCDETLHASTICGWKEKSNHQAVRAFYFHLVQIFYSIIADKVVHIVIKITHREQLWIWEDLCQDIIQGLIDCGMNQSKIINELFNKAQCGKTSLEDTRKILRILYKILEDDSWINDQDTAAAIERLLTLYHKSLSYYPDEKQLILKEGFGICILNIIRHLPNWHLITILSQISLWTLEENSFNDEIILELSNILEFAADCYKMDILENTQVKKLFFIILKMISSSNPSVSIMGNRVLQNLIDRRKNKLQFQSIKNFFDNTDYDIRINQHNRRDQDFLKQHRDLVHDSFLQCVMYHSSSRINLEAIYCTICLIAVEVPCGFTAAALVCLIMNIQDLTLEHLDINRPVTYHVHATVLAIMTLICWIHKAKVFYVYVNNVLMERAQWAPHLNPPIATHYDFAIHHVLWDKPELFFIDWEVRFGLWKCFRL